VKRSLGVDLGEIVCPKILQILRQAPLESSTAVSSKKQQYGPYSKMPSVKIHQLCFAKKVPQFPNLKLFQPRFIQKFHLKLVSRQRLLNNPECQSIYLDINRLYSNWIFPSPKPIFQALGNFNKKSWIMILSKFCK